MPSTVKKNVLFSWGAHAFAMLVGFFLMPYVLSVLGDKQYGSWVFINSLAGYASLLYVGFGETISRYVSKFHSEGNTKRINEVVSLVLTIYLGMGLVALLGAATLCWLAPVLSNWEEPQLTEVRWVILILGLNVFMGLSGSVFGGVLLGLRRFDLERGISFCSDILRLVMIVVFLRGEYGLLTIALIYFVITLAENVSYCVLAFRTLPGLTVSLTGWNKQTFTECSSFSGMAFINAIAAQLIYATDTVVIGTMLGTDAIVPYYIGLRLAQFIRQPIDKIAHVVMPTAGALQGAADLHKLHRFLLKAFGISFLLSTGAFVGAWFFGPAVIATWMGPNFPEAQQVLMILLGAQIVSLPMSILRAFLFGKGTVAVPALIYLAEAGTNLGLSIWACQQYGVVGVAWGTAIPIVVFELGLLLPFAIRALDISVWRLVREAIMPPLVPVAALYGYGALVLFLAWDIGNWPMLIAVTAGGAGVLGVVWLSMSRLKLVSEGFD
jgi:O-antigen/teichoic acid export membrane protein